MHYMEILHKIIEKGIASAIKDYAGKPDKLTGSIEGFEACRRKTPYQLDRLLKSANEDAAAARHKNEYWRIRCRAAEIEWVCNCISVFLMNKGRPVIVAPTARAAIMVASIMESFKPN